MELRLDLWGRGKLGTNYRTRLIIYSVDSRFRSLLEHNNILRVTANILQIIIKSEEISFLFYLRNIFSLLFDNLIQRWHTHMVSLRILIVLPIISSYLYWVWFWKIWKSLLYYQIIIPFLRYVNNFLTSPNRNNRISPNFRSLLIIHLHHLQFLTLMP